ncbi:MAG: hypothetical protein IK125_02490 [Lachnospiraceae bacterium]|nr:hypothetical protein [Lachnospiraceae bacterium]
MNNKSIWRGRKSEYLAYFVLSALMLLLVPFIMANNEPNKKNGGSEYVLYSRDGWSLDKSHGEPHETTDEFGNVYPRSIVRYLERKYAGEDVKKGTLKVSAGYPIALSSNNFDQARIKAAYNSNAAKAITKSGICWSSAITSMLEYNSGRTLNGVQFGKVVVNTAVEKKYVSPPNGGMKMGNICKLVTAMMPKIGLTTKKGNEDYYDIWESMLSEFNYNRVCLLGIPDHIMCACGSEFARTSWKTLKGKTVTKTDEFVVVNDTWEDSSYRRYSFYPVEMIATGLFSRYEFGIIKMISK